MSTTELWAYRTVLIITLALILVEFIILTSMSFSFYQFFIGLKPFFDSKCNISCKDTKGVNNSYVYMKKKPWYMQNGTIRPLPGDRKDIWPEDTLSNDRYFNQLMYIPTAVTTNNIKTINADSILLNKTETTDSIFAQCPVNKCILTHDKFSADALIFNSYVHEDKNWLVRLEQVWVLYVTESPLVTKISNDNVSWTASYRYDSDIIVNYGQWAYYNKSIKILPQVKNYAEGKAKKVAWFVSNCESKNYRFEYVKELKKYIDVDVYGECGDKKCPENQDCMETLAKNYKFYLAFEDVNCRGYITDQFTAALKNGMLPIVMGAHPNDYNKVAPFNSFIHVNYFLSVQELADYLHELDKNDNLYNSYFQWRGTGEFIRNDFFFCRLCAMLHANKPAKNYDDFKDWWKPQGTCLLKPNDTWLPKLKDVEVNDTKPDLPREFGLEFKKYNNLD